MNTTLRILAMSTTLLLLTGCASKEPTFGDRVAAEGAGIESLGNQWQAGKKLVEKGRKQIRKGESLLARGRESIDSGEAAVEKGERMMRESERAYDSQVSR